ncbi:hypothetical protein ZIOFF_008325 [Zingiber officinale]|uniref:B box-type domain-containing protein n=1 Tax=Zingiber officinale TaxID=94328 RepID=A0A8J5II26_ZINOF|nr:hypothetical protein ZIOFF_008325 [Zingiber officinale]
MIFHVFRRSRCTTWAPAACVWLAAGGGDAPLETHVGPYAAAHRTATVHRVVKMDERDPSPPAPSCVGNCAFQLENKSIIRADEEVEQEEGEEEGEEESSEIELGKRIEKLRWVELLLVGEFFGSCEQHKEDRKSEENIFCVDCGSRMCPHCLAGRHSDHRLLQIRRYVYQDVVRVHDMANLLDCSKVQVSYNSSNLIRKYPQSCKLHCESCAAKAEEAIQAIENEHQWPRMQNLPSVHLRFPLLLLHHLLGYSIPKIRLVSDVDSPVLTVKEPTVCCQSEPLLADRPASSEDQPSPSPAASPPPFDEGQEDAGRSIPEPSVRKVHRRKGFPRRAPF